MALTAKPISTISYNSEEFLKRKLDQLLNGHIVDDYRYIKHKGENGDKNHIHVIMYPNKRIDTGTLKDEFNEADPQSDKALGVMPFRTSKPDHWLMYVIHDKDYLKAHKKDNNDDGKIEYSIDEIVTPYPDQLTRDYRSALPLKQTENQLILDYIIKQHMTVTEICSIANVNPQKVAILARAYQMERYDLDRQQMENIDQQNINRALSVFGEVKTIDDLGGTKYEKRNNLSKALVTNYKVDDSTGEVLTEKEIITIDDSER